MKQTMSLSKVICLSEYTRLYPTYQEYIACDIAKYPEMNVCVMHSCGCETMHKNVGSERNSLLCVITFALCPIPEMIYFICLALI